MRAFFVTMLVACGGDHRAVTVDAVVVDTSVVDTSVVDTSLDAPVDAAIDMPVDAALDAPVDAVIDMGPIPDASPMAHQFPDHTVQSGQEILNLCSSWTLDNAVEWRVDRVEFSQNEALRASSWYFVPDTAFAGAGADGDWACSDRAFSPSAAAGVGGGLLFRQSVDAPAETQAFGPGAAVLVPAHARIVGVRQHVNVTGNPITGHSAMVLGIDPSATVLLHAVIVSYDKLTIPAMAMSRFFGTCTVATTRVHYLQPNARGLATRVFATIAGGPSDGTTMLDASPLVLGVASGVTPASPIDMTAATGITFGCEYANPRTTTVMWGFGDQEQCDVLAFVEASGARGSIQQVNFAGTSGALQLFTGSCGVTAL